MLSGYGVAVFEEDLIDVIGPLDVVGVIKIEGTGDPELISFRHVMQKIPAVEE